MTNIIGHAVTNQLDIGCCCGLIANCITNGGCIFCHREVQCIPIPTIGCVGVHSTSPNDGVVFLGFQVVAVHSLNQRLQSSRSLFTIVHSDNVGQGAVGNRQSTAVDIQSNVTCQILRIDAVDFHIVAAILLDRCRALAEGEVCDVAGYIKIEPNCNLVPEYQGHTVQVDAVQVVRYGNFGNFSRNSNIFNCDATVGQIAGIVVKVGLGSCTVVQHILDHFLNFSIIAAVQNGVGIHTNRIFAGMHNFSSVFHSQADGIGHLCSCNIDSYNLSGDCGSYGFTVYGCGNGVVFAVEMELHADVIAQRNIPSCQCIRFACGKYGCGQH